MGNSQRKKGTAGCVPAPLIWRLGVLVVIETVMIVLVVAGYDPTTALACASGGGLAAGHVARGLFELPRTARVDEVAR